MPSTNNINQVADLTAKIKQAKSAALFQYQGLTAEDLAALRRHVKEQGGVIEVAKNTLLSRALANLNITLPEKLTGPTALALANVDEVAPLKEIDKINTEKELTSFKYGFYENKLLDLDTLKRFLSLPSKSALVSQFINGLSQPLYRLLYALRFNQSQLVLTLKALADKKSVTN